MCEETSRQMQEIVTDIRQRAERAERNFDRASEEIAFLSGQSIDLFSRSAARQVTDIAVRSKAACDQLYAAYQSFVDLLDEECRPLLSKSPSFAAVQAVKELIVWLNEESKIENSFTAALNQKQLGDVANVRYMPSIHALTVQSFWEAKCERFTDQTEVPQPIPGIPNSPSVGVTAPLPKKDPNAEAKDREALAAWETQVQQIQKTREQLLQAQLESFRAMRLQEIEDKYKQSMGKALEQKNRRMIEQAEAEKKLAGLGIFAFGEKQQCRRIIENCKEELCEIEEELLHLKTTYTWEQEELSEDLEAYRWDLEQQIEAAHPLPKKPERTFAMPTVSNTDARAEILQVLSSGGRMTISELTESSPACAALGHLRVSSLLRQLILEQKVERFDENGKMYFCAK